MTLTIIERPEGQREDYLFFADAEGRTFKALHHPQTSAGGQPVIGLSVAVVDADGHALKLPNGDADVTWHSHTFTAEEMAAADFDLSARIAALLHDLAERKAREVAARGQIAALGDVWRAGAIKLEGDKA